MLAAKTASAPPSVTPSTRCSSAPTPPEAMTGTSTASVIVEVSGRSKPFLVPSRSIDVSRISPAPRRTTSLAHTTASTPVRVRPPCVKTSKPDAVSSLLRASIATTQHCAPNSRLISRINSGRFTAAVLTDTLSAPAINKRRASSTVRIPPPIVNGMKTCSATARAISTVVSRSPDDAVMSRNTSSSAPCSS